MLQNDPPKPSSPDVYIEKQPAFTAFVSQFGGFGMDDWTISGKAKALTEVGATVRTATELSAAGLGKNDLARRRDDPKGLPDGLVPNHTVCSCAVTEGSLLLAVRRLLQVNCLLSCLTACCHETLAATTCLFAAGAGQAGGAL